MLSKLIQKQQHLTLKQLKQRQVEGEKRRKHLQGLIQKNRELKTRAFTVREYEHLIKKNQEIKTKIDQAIQGTSKSPKSRHDIKSSQQSPSGGSELTERRVVLPQHLNHIEECAEEDKGPQEHRIVSYHELAPFVYHQRPGNEQATHRSSSRLSGKEEQPVALP